MRKLLVLLMILCFVLSFGCAKEIEAPPEAPAPEPVPELTPIEPEEEEIVAPPEEVEEEETIGTRVEGTEREPVEEEVPEEIQEIQLLANKTMDMTEITISAGTTLAWKNYDTWPHILAVETGKGFDTIRHAESDRLLEGSVWEYTFNDKGTFLVRDIFSGPMRMTVTVE